MLLFELSIIDFSIVHHVFAYVLVIANNKICMCSCREVVAHPVTIVPCSDCYTIRNSHVTICTKSFLQHIFMKLMRNCDITQFWQKLKIIIH